MSRFYASIKGARGEATRQGTPASGIHGRIRGWDVGVSIEGRADGDADVFNIFVTDGSNGFRERWVGSVMLVGTQPQFLPRSELTNDE